MQGKVTLLDQPLIDAETPLHRLASVIREDHYSDIRRNGGKEFPNLLVQGRVVLLDRLTVGRIGLIARMPFVEVLPERVVYSIRSDLMEGEEVPPFLGP